MSFQSIWLAFIFSHSSNLNSKLKIYLKASNFLPKDLWLVKNKYSDCRKFMKFFKTHALCNRIKFMLDTAMLFQSLKTWRICLSWFKYILLTVFLMDVLYITSCELLRVLWCLLKLKLVKDSYTHIWRIELRKNEVFWNYD